MKKIDHLGIKDLPEDDKPREKMCRFGSHCLTDAELLAIIIGTGTPDLTAIELSQQILKAFDNRLEALLTASVEELIGNSALKGIGPAKAAKIKAAIELGRRINRGKVEYPQVTSPKEVADFLLEEMRHYQQEHFVILLLNTKNRIYKVEEISVGTINASLVHPREVFSAAIRQHAVSIILAHNHPSGDPAPSREDQRITDRLRATGELVGIPVLDHIIVGGDAYLSFKEDSLL
ncbi:RadC family protein [Eubacterium aggregans]|nr:DNA repair protein RadC [Eubacterium aggregans]MDD4691604.1 DNA repair protein RadC [Eubacterium aggregans]